MLRWITVLDFDMYEVVPHRPFLRENLTIGIEQDGVVERLPKAALRTSGHLSFRDLKHAASKYGLAGDTRAQLLTRLAQHIAPGDAEFAQLVAEEIVPAGGLDVLPTDPLFDAAWDEMDPDDKAEMQDVQKAVARQKCNAARLGNLVAAGKAKARARQQQRAAAKAKAKAAGAPAPPAVPLAAPPAAPPGAAQPAVPGPPPKAAAPLVPPGAAQPAVAGPPPKAAAPHLAVARAAPAIHGEYIYVPFAAGQLVYSLRLLKINAHCLADAHQSTLTMRPCKCHMDRTIAGNIRDVVVKARPLGLLALWLKKAHEAGTASYLFINERPWS